MTSLQKNIFNAFYASIFLYSARRIFKKIRPISFDDAYSYLKTLPGHKGDTKLLLVSQDGMAYHVATVPRKYAMKVNSELADAMRGIRGWKSSYVLDPNEKSLWPIHSNVSIVQLIPPEWADRIPKAANAIKKVMGES